MNEKQVNYVQTFIEKSINSLTATETRLYLWLLTHADDSMHCAASYRELALATEMSENGVRFGIGALTRMGLLKRKARKTRKSPMVYRILAPKTPTGDLRALRKEAQLAPASD